jgi:NAD(P)-dependent dehydrogenase (short-subunit alcohol dehydrogenase family)
MQPASYPSLEGRRVLVTGGGSGIGAAMVEAFTAQGCRVAFVDLAKEPSLEVVGRLSPAPIFRQLDLRNVESLIATFAEIEGQLGGIDVLVNNAASDDRHKPEEVTPTYWDERIATNLRHVFFASQAVLSGMQARKSGSIINFSSISWHLGLPGLLIYETAKAGIEGMTRALAREVGADGIRVNAIVPGNVETPRQDRWYTPAGAAEILRLQSLKVRIQPKDVAALALFLASDDARMCTGESYWINAGWR